MIGQPLFVHSFNQKLNVMTNVVKIMTPAGIEIIIDESDQQIISGYNWCSLKRKNTFYAVAEFKEDGERKHIFMHRLIMGVTNPSVYIDHKNRNGLDNRRSNLRECTHSQNMRNQIRKERSYTKYKGVYLEKGRMNRARPFIAKIAFNKKPIFLGSFATDLEAAIAYNKAAIQYHGEFARLNIIDH